MTQTFITDFFSTCSVCGENTKKCQKVEEKDICSLLCELTLKTKDVTVDISTMLNKLTFKEEATRSNLQDILRKISLRNLKEVDQYNE